MHRSYWITGMFLLLFVQLYSQKHYHMWPYGISYQFPGQWPNLRCIFDSRGDKVSTYPSGNPISISGTIAAVCDHDGNLVLYTNGHAIADSTHQIIEDGSDLNPSIYFNPTYKNYDCHNCHTMLNWGDSLYTLIHIGADGSQGLPYNLRYLHRTDVRYSDTLNAFKTIGKNTVIADGKYELFNIVKHGNGKDYWVVQPALQRDTFHFYLLTPDTMYLHHSQRIGPLYEQGNTCYAPGTNSISPDGRKYVRFNNKCGMWLYDLDRCEGLLSNPRLVHIPVLPVQPGASTEFSSDSRYLYYTSSTVVYQIDTEADVLIPDTVAVYDGYVDPFATRFFSLGRQADGKIYITSTNGVLSLHVIEYPDSAGLACQVNQHSFKLAGTIAWGILRPVNVWLGPAGCDSTNTVTTLAPPVRSLRIWPQPAASEVMVVLEGGEGDPHLRQIAVYTHTGQQVYQGVMPAWSYIHHFHVEDWPSGIYTVVLLDRGQPTAVGRMSVVR